MSEIMICPLEQIELTSCPVKTCQWWGQEAKHCCIAHNGLHEEKDLTIKMVSRYKGLSIEKGKKLRNKGMRRIHNLIVLKTFVEWVEKNSSIKIKTNEDIEKWVRSLVVEVYPYNVELIKWDDKKVWASVTKSVWRKFYREHPGIKQLPLHRILGFSEDFTKMVAKKFKSV